MSTKFLGFLGLSEWGAPCQSMQTTHISYTAPVQIQTHCSSQTLHQFKFLMEKHCTSLNFEMLFIHLKKNSTKQLRSHITTNMHLTIAAHERDTHCMNYSTSYLVTIETLSNCVHAMNLSARTGKLVMTKCSCANTL